MSDIVGRIGNLGYDLLGLDGIVYMTKGTDTSIPPACPEHCQSCAVSCSTCGAGCSTGPN